MIDAVVSRRIASINELCEIANAREALREFAYRMTSEASVTPPFSQVAQINRSSWRMRDATSLVLSLYGEFELAIDELFVAYFAELDRLSLPYLTLPEVLRSSLRVGIGGILSKWSSTNYLYAHLSEERIVGGYANGLAGSKYSILPEAFLTDSNNYRWETIQKIFRRVGIDSCEIAATDTDLGRDLSALTTSMSHTLPSLLDEIVRKRNEYAHGNSTDVPGVSTLNSYARFLEILIRRMGEVLETHYIGDLIRSGSIVHKANVIHAYRDNIVGVRAVTDFCFSKNEVVWFGRRMIGKASIESIRIVDEECDQIRGVAGKEFGLKLNSRLRVGDRIWTRPN